MVNHVVASGESNNKNAVIFATSLILIIAIVASVSFFAGSSTQSPTPTPNSQTLSAQTQTLPPRETIPPTQPNSQTETPKIISPTPSPVLKTKTINADPKLDGFQSSNGGGNTGIDIRVGRNVNLISRGFVSFDLSTLTSINIQKAQIKLYQAKITGDPYLAGQAVGVDSLYYGDTLENQDYNKTPEKSSFGVLSDNANLEWKELNITSILKEAIDNGRAQIQFRFKLANEVKGGDVTGDFAYFESAENYFGTNKSPQLVVQYYQ